MTKQRSVKIKLTVGFYIYSALVLMLGRFNIYVIYVISVLIHELAHLFMSNRLGYRCNYISMSVFGGVLCGEYDSLVRKDEIKIALMGPLCNLVIVLVFYAIWWIKPVVYNYTYEIAEANLFLALINLLPCYSLDGGRILTAIMEEKIGRKRAVKISQMISSIIGVLFFAMFIVTLIYGKANFSLGFFGLLVFIGGMVKVEESIYEKIMYTTLLNEKIKRGLETKFLTVIEDMKIIEAYAKITRNYFWVFRVVDKSGSFKASFSAVEIEKLLTKGNCYITFSQLLANNGLI